MSPEGGDAATQAMTPKFSAIGSRIEVLDAGSDFIADTATHEYPTGTRNESINTSQGPSEHHNSGIAAQTVSQLTLALLSAVVRPEDASSGGVRAAGILSGTIVDPAWSVPVDLCLLSKGIGHLEQMFPADGFHVVSWTLGS